jgi:hypothetical protein
VGICNLCRLPSLAPGQADGIGEDRDGVLELELLGGVALMQTLVSRVINPWRIGSLQSWNGLNAAKLIGGAVTAGDGLLGLAGRD